jgi:hypothetical protein
MTTLALALAALTFIASATAHLNRDRNDGAYTPFPIGS